MIVVAVEPHPSLRAAAFTTVFPAALGETGSPPWLADLLHLDAAAPFTPDEALRGAIRDMLRHGGYKPTGRGKPASEYLVRAAADGALGSINVAVDACNATSLHSGIPISVVDLDRARAPFRIATAAEGDRYVFNASGQEIDLAGLLCLSDAEGPCGNAVKDAQRTKTSSATIRTLSVLWGCAGHESRLQQGTAWYRELLERAGARTADVALDRPAEAR
jgi:DNA/RNA-binding domain of Phe-tRNA-synthetase-like protein